MVEEMHEGTFGTHANGNAIAKKIMRAGYSWLTMKTDCCNHVKKCHKCQIYADNINAPPNPLNVLTSPWPFSMWGMDVIRPIELKASNGHRFILVTIDYITKWVEANSYASVTQKEVLRFIKRDLIPSLRVLAEASLDESEWVQARHDQLNMIDGRRLTTICHRQLCQKRIMKAYVKKVRPCQFREGDLILKKILPIQKDNRGKWTPNYEGAYVVKKAFSGGALIQIDTDREDLHLTINSDAVKKYYA
ncbi:PREDICTED: uncharacterized protein LOC109327656 [Lupinus angustifolius]|uniref:uncharacterized protein LOC109327656 n=1 Tax=Lupinus angustifolius TaxID=3871 RepID=UPI00092FBDE6|nr:PREDICTED: uncharacterized protein LOC109327656 [Lupinus angustifolius]